MNQRIHFIGIGGTGMGPLAKIFLEMGWQVSGSDLKMSETTEYLERLGARISLGHKAEHIDGAAHVVFSSAIPKDNPEYAAALERNLHYTTGRSWWRSCSTTAAELLSAAPTVSPQPRP